ncbi:MAG: SDR family oxidoreductase [Ardenticatenaceae bacterium]
MKDQRSWVALVTGASRKVGIGAAIARELAGDGADVFVTYFRPYDHESGLAGDADEPERLLAELRALGCRADGLELDLSDPEAPKELFDAVEKSLGVVSVLVNNATYSMRDSIETLDAAGLDKHYAINLRAMALLCAEFVRRYKNENKNQNQDQKSMPKEAYGRIINLTSGQSLGAMPDELAYVATKGAVEAFTSSLSTAVAPLGITVNAVDPGITDTGWIAPDLKAKWSAQSPMGRVGTPQDAARLIRFLASAEAKWITGQIIHSRGGL